MTEAHAAGEHHPVDRAPARLARAQAVLDIAMMRGAAGLTQKELADAVGASQQSVAFWEKNARPPRADTLLKIAADLGVRADEVHGEDQQETTAKQLPHHGPAGIVVRTFEQVRALPRHQQLKVVELVHILLRHYKKKTS